MAGIVVDHKESGVRYAISEKNFDPKAHKKVRNLKAGETVLGFKPLRKGSIGKSETPDTEGSAPAEAANE
jgi:hypothetical protein